MKTWILWTVAGTVPSSAFNLYRWALTDKTTSQRILSALIFSLSMLWDAYGLLLAFGLLS